MKFLGILGLGEDKEHEGSVRVVVGYGMERKVTERDDWTSGTFGGDVKT